MAHGDGSRAAAFASWAVFASSQYLRVDVVDDLRVAAAWGGRRRGGGEEVEIDQEIETGLDVAPLGKIGPLMALHVACSEAVVDITLPDMVENGLGRRKLDGVMRTVYAPRVAL